MLLTRVIAKLELGGAQLGALRLTQALRKHGVETRLIAAQAEPEGMELFERAGLEVEVWPRPAGLEMQYACDPRFAAWLRPRLLGADLVHAHMLGAWWAAARAIPGGVPLVASEHNSIAWPIALETQARAALVRVDRFLAHGPQAREFAIARGLSADRIERGISAIDPHLPEIDRSLASERIVFAGRLQREKGPDLLLDALAAIERPPATYVLGSGPLLESLRLRAGELGIGRTIRFCGWQTDPGRWIRGARACVVPSRRESWSQSAVQAMALGTPVIGTDVEGLPDTLGEGRGVIVDAGDPPAIASALTRLLAGREVPNLDAARRYAVGFFPEPVGRHYLKLYRALIGHRRASVAIGGRTPARPRRRVRGPALSPGARG